MRSSAHDDEWGPASPEWWEICESCGGWYNWFSVIVVPGFEMFGWMHLVNTGCPRTREMDFTDDRDTMD